MEKKKPPQPHKGKASNVTIIAVDVPSRDRPVNIEILQSRPDLCDDLGLRPSPSSPTSTPTKGHDTTIVSPSSQSDTNNPDTTKQPRHLFIMFPGNPGVVYFYREMIDLLVHSGHKVVGGGPNAAAAPTEEASIPNSSTSNSSGILIDAIVCGFGYHSLQELNDHHTQLLLADQIELLSALLHKIRTHLLGSGNGGRCLYDVVHVGGHSIGGYLALEMADRFSSNSRQQEASTDSSGTAATAIAPLTFNNFLNGRIFLLTPTIHKMGVSPNGWKNLLLFLPPVIELATRLVAAIVGLCAEVIVRSVLSIAQPLLSYEHQSVVMNMACRTNMLKNVLYLGRSEMQYVDVLQTDQLRRLKHKMVAFYALYDGWAPRSYYREVAAAIAIPSEKIKTDKQIWADLSEIRNKNSSIYQYHLKVKAAESAVAKLTAANNNESYDTEENRTATKDCAAAPPAFPVCEMFMDPAFPHAWCVSHNRDVVEKMILPYMLD